MELMFSVCVITYNQEKFISQTLDSILSQKHNFKYEIIIGEDCSSDKTKDIINEYVNKYPEIIKPLYNEPNLGLVKNYFNVIKHCSGKYIMECAGDDYWLPGKVAYQIDYMEKHPEIGMCYGKAKRWNEWESKFSKKSFGSKKETFQDLLEGNDIPAPSVCFRKDLINNYIEEIDPEQKNWMMEDYPFWIYCSLKSKIQFIPEYYAVYRELKNSISHIDDSEKQFLFSKNTYECLSFFTEREKLLFKPKSDAQLWFELSYDRLLRQYTSDDANRLREAFYKMETKTRKDKIINFVCKSKIMFYFFKVLRKIL